MFSFHENRGYHDGASSALDGDAAVVEKNDVSRHPNWEVATQLGGGTELDLGALEPGSGRWMGREGEGAQEAFEPDRVPLPIKDSVIGRLFGMVRGA